MAAQQIDYDQLFDLDMAMDYPLSSFIGGEENNTATTATTAEAEAEESSIIEELPSVNAYGGGVCSVCLEDYYHQSSSSSGDGNNNKQVPCGHIFHGACIQSWLSRHDSCPLCRSKVFAAAAASASASVS